MPIDCAERSGHGSGTTKTKTTTTIELAERGDVYEVGSDATPCPRPFRAPARRRNPCHTTHLKRHAHALTSSVICK